ncbi:MAG: FAD-binding oxidoreductase [Gammaproteobacteria bacterium]|nr:FAD-binding oxidoreductase [Gammaproteobacteria bacterium]
MSDYLIIGGGIHGAACAFELARQGAKVRLLESSSIASAASGGPGQRGVRANKRDRRELPLMALAYRRWPSLHEELGCAPTYQRTGSLTLIERDQDLEAAPARVWMQEQLGIESRLVMREELVEMAPGLADGVQAAIHCPGDGTARHADTTRHFAEAARRAGARIDEHTALESLHMQGSRVSAAITATGERIEIGKCCLLLSNASVAELLRRSVGLTLPVWSTCLQVMLVRPMSPMRIDHLIGHLSRTVAIKSECDGQVMISGGFRGVWDASSHTGSTVPEAIERNLAEAVAVFPALAGAEVVCADANHLEAMCIDEVPIIDRLSADSNLYYATGWTGHGWAIAPAVSRLLVEWVRSGDRPPLLAPFSRDRFAPR